MHSLAVQYCMLAKCLTLYTTDCLTPGLSVRNRRFRYYCRFSPISLITNIGFPTYDDIYLHSYYSATYKTFNGPRIALLTSYRFGRSYSVRSVHLTGNLTKKDFISNETLKSFSTYSVDCNIRPYKYMLFFVKMVYKIFVFFFLCRL
jgi:hypothetical protein